MCVRRAPPGPRAPRRFRSRLATILPYLANHLRVTLLARWHAPPHLVQEVQQERHVNRTILTGCLRHWKNREALSVCGYVEVRYPTLIANLRIRPETWLSRRERATVHCVVDDHNTIVRIGVEHFPAGSRPHRVHAAAVGNQPLLARYREGAHVDFESS